MIEIINDLELGVFAESGGSTGGRSCFPTGEVIQSPFGAWGLSIEQKEVFTAPCNGYLMIDNYSSDYELILTVELNGTWMGNFIFSCGSMRAYEYGYIPLAKGSVVKASLTNLTQTTNKFEQLVTQFIKCE